MNFNIDIHVLYKIFIVCKKEIKKYQTNLNFRLSKKFQAMYKVNIDMYILFNALNG